MKIKVNYDIETTLVREYYPNNIEYYSIPEPFIEIEDNAQILDKQMCVIGGIYQEYVAPLSIRLTQAKLSKIAQLKANRDASNLRPLTSGQAYEVIETEPHEFTKTTNKVYFAFSLAATSQPSTDPNSIILGTLLASMSDPSFYLRYSCAILEGEVIRKGYVAIDAIAANEIRIHITQRVEAAVAYANSLEKEINLASSLEELSNININF